MHEMKIGELGEFGLIELLAKMMAQEAPNTVQVREGQGFRLLLGIGDDTAAWQNLSSSTELLTTDTMVHGVHFALDRVTWEELGWKVMAVNYSDIAAMGGTPLYSIVTLGLPEDTVVEDVTEMYRGMLEVCREYGGAVVGGDVVGSPVLFITVALTGFSPGPPLTRSSACPRDLVAVTGYLGSSGGGLRTLLQGLNIEAGIAQYLKEAHNRPTPCIVQGQALRNRGVKAAIDVSDGLVDDLSKICRASGVGAVIDVSKVPVHPMLKKAFPKDYLSLALTGGEDYELLFTAPEKVMAQICPDLQGPVTVIGEIVPGEAAEVRVLDEKGQVVSVDKGGWDHFR